MIVNEGGKKLPKLTTPGAAADLLTGKQLIDQYGNVIDGSMPIVEAKAPGFLTPHLQMHGSIDAFVVYKKGYYDSNALTKTYTLSSEDDPNFVPENIARGKTIFGVAGTAIIAKSISSSASLDIEIESETILTIPMGSIEECYFSLYLRKFGSEESTLAFAYAHKYGGQLYVSGDSSISYANVNIKSSSDTATEILLTGLYGKYSKITSYSGKAIIEETI